MKETKYIYSGPSFPPIEINPVIYQPVFFEAEINLESELFYDLRKANGITPYRLNESTAQDLKEIRQFFKDKKDGFFFVFDKKQLLGSVLCRDNYIQCLCVYPAVQRQGLGTALTQYAVNHIYSKGYKQVELHVMDGNEPAHGLYKKLGFFQILD